MVIGLVSGLHRASIGLLFGFQPRFELDQPSGQVKDRAGGAVYSLAILTIVRTHAPRTATRPDLTPNNCPLLCSAGAVDSF